MSRVDPHSYTDIDQGRVRSIAIDWVVDFATRRLRGEVTLQLEGAKGGVLDLDTRDLEIESVKGPKGETLGWELGERESFMGQCLRIQLPEGSESLTIAYQTSQDASALQWLEPANTAGKVHPYLFSQCQPHHARSMLPLQDSASVRFSYQAKVEVPEALVAVMSAAPGESAKGDKGRKVYHFEMPQPIPGYLLALAVGNIANRDLGPRSRVYTEPEMLDAAAWEFESVDSMLQKAEALFGPYRWERYDFLVMPPAFPYGGMENPRLTSLTPSLLAGDRSLVNVLAHELAHSWTGNLITSASMNDFWLNEGFTVWAERRILEALEGEEAVSLSAAIGRADLEEAIEDFGKGSPLTRLKNDLSGVDPDEIYSVVPYEKGCLLVQLLERTVGREKWDSFMRKYMDRFEFTSITTEDFLAFLDEQLPGTAEKVKAKQWIYEPNVPANEPPFSSPRREELQRLGKNFTKGERPDPAKAKKWRIDEWLVWFAALPTKLSQEDCDWLESTFSFNESGNAEILNKWLAIAASSSYEPSYEKLRDFLGTFGRMKYLKPLYKAMYENPDTRALALSIYQQHKDLYHPIARAGLESILKLSK